MIAINNLSFEFGGRYLYRNVNWHIKPGERIGLIGMNGTGKSTLLRLINGEYQPSEGNISKPRNLTIGFLNQDQLSFQSDDTILHVALTAFEEALKLELEIEAILKKMETDYSDEIIQQLSDKQEAFERLDGYNLHYKTEKVLEGLGFTTEQLTQPYKKFSGGWRMRVMLAKLLLQKPDLLMLDEPTNHLDLPTIEWLEEYLRSYEGSVIVVSHDREFLDRMVNKIVEVSLQKVTEYPGNYSNYIDAKSLRTEQHQREYENQQQFIRQQEALINRFKAKASKASMAQSRVKMLDRIERIDAPEDDNREIKIDFRIGQQSGKVVVDLQNVSKQFPDIEIVRNATREIVRGDKIALIGANGKGKSTLLRMIAGTESYQGTINRGYNVHEAFYAQHQLESLTLENEILDEMRAYGKDRTDTELRTLLGCFLFNGDDVFKKIKVLSGGEKARVALARTLLAEANFLLLDEPTNHLDIRSINILIQALQQYEGTFIVVSHDRYFISQIANKVWWLEDKELKEYPGTYAEYDYWHHKQLEEKERLAAQAQKSVTKKEKAQPVEKKQEPKPANRAKELTKQFEQAEQRVDELKKKISDMELLFGQAEYLNNVQKMNELRSSYEAAKKALADAEQEYNQAFEALMQEQQ
jgi:ATP-binding cassette subfamily F protein 3